MKRRTKSNPTWAWDGFNAAQRKADRGERCIAASRDEYTPEKGWFHLRTALPWEQKSDYRHLQGHSHLGHIEADGWWVDIFLVFEGGKVDGVVANYKKDLRPARPLRRGGVVSAPWSPRRTTKRYPYTEEGFQEMLDELEMSILDPVEYIARIGADLDTLPKKNPRAKKNPKVRLTGIYGSSADMLGLSAFDWVQTRLPVKTKSYTQYSFLYIAVGKACSFRLEILVGQDKTDFCLYSTVGDPKKPILGYEKVTTETGVVRGQLSREKLNKAMTWVDIKVAEKIGISPLELAFLPVK